MSALEALSLVWITDGRGDVGRIVEIARAAIDGGLAAIQVREEKLSARALCGLCAELRPLLAARNGLLLVNDRVDVAASAADGVHLGRRSLTPEHARAVLGPNKLIGYSAHDLAEVEWAAAGGADYASLSPVFATASKPGVEPLGVDRTRDIAARASLPVSWLGGFDAARVAEVAPLRPSGVAVMSALASAADPGAVARALCGALAQR